MSLLTSLDLPGDLKRLSIEELEQLAAEIREKLIEIGEKCGGHLASNLGVVELSIALHAIMESPADKLIWDVSHQCYTHKMLTGRLDAILTLRQTNGLSGFTKITESVHDAFGAGHASTALSAGLGMAHARDLKNERYSVVAIVGDSSLSGGMAFEALNNAIRLKRTKSNFVCILNDNDMAISRPIGQMADYLTRVRTSPSYTAVKGKLEHIFSQIPRIGHPLHQRVEKTVERLRDIVLNFKFGVIFEEYGFRYLGPLDGHNIPCLMAALKYARTYPGPIMLHVITKKGKGYDPAEQDPFHYHGISPKKWDMLETDIPKAPTYTEVFGEALVELAETDPALVAITPAMTIGSGLVQFEERFPKRFFDVGIAEEHAVTFAAGLAREGLKPVLAIYSTFLQRGYDQVMHDVCLQHLPVIFAMDRAGLVGADGPTHHGVFDLTYLLPLPNMIVLAPKDAAELRAMLAWSLTVTDQAVALRYPRGEAPVLSETVTQPIRLGKAEVVVPETSEKPLDIVILAVGSMVKPALTAVQALPHINAAVINLRFLKPLDTELIRDRAIRARRVLVLEEGQGIGGVFHYILHELGPMNRSLADFHSLALPDQFISHGNDKLLLDQVGLSPEKIAEKIRTLCEA